MIDMKDLFCMLGMLCVAVVGITTAFITPIFLITWAICYVGGCK